MSKVVSKTRQVGMAGAFAVAFAVMGAVALLMTTASATLAATAPVISRPPEDSYDNDAAFTLSGTAPANTTLKVYEESVGQYYVGHVNVDSTGKWALALSGVSEDKHAYKAKVTDMDGSVSTWSNTRTVKVDTKAPAAPYLAPYFSGGKAYGTVEPNNTVEVFMTHDTTTSLGTAQADGQGNWSSKEIFISMGKGDAYWFKAKATDPAGNVSGRSDERLTNVIDTD
jgi:hypothetical protein